MIIRYLNGGKVDDFFKSGMLLAQFNYFNNQAINFAFIQDGNQEDHKRFLVCYWRIKKLK